MNQAQAAPDPAASLPSPGVGKLWIALAEGARGDDRFGYRNEFVNLTRLAKTAAAMALLRK
jgi:hypothetical protein